MYRMVLRILYTSAMVILFAVAATAQVPTQIPKKPNPRPSPTPVVEPFDKATVAIMASKCVSLETDAGLIEIELYPESAPESVRNFLNLVATGLLDTTTFSRVVPKFVVQAGNLWTRTGGVDKALAARATRKLPDEPNKILHERGIVSMARLDEPNSATTDFFILVEKAPYLDGTFAGFGKVIKGMDVVDTMNKATVVEETPEKPVRIKKALVGTCSPIVPTPALQPKP